MLENQEVLNKAITNFKPEIIVHLAAQAGVRFIKKQGCGIIVYILPLDKKNLDNNRFVKFLETFSKVVSCQNILAIFV